MGPTSFNVYNISLSLSIGWSNESSKLEIILILFEVGIKWLKSKLTVNINKSIWKTKTKNADHVHPLNSIKTLGHWMMIKIMPSFPG